MIHNGIFCNGFRGFSLIGNYPSEFLMCDLVNTVTTRSTMCSVIVIVMPSEVIVLEHTVPYKSRFNKIGEQEFKLFCLTGLAK